MLPHPILKGTYCTLRRVYRERSASQEQWLLPAVSSLLAMLLAMLPVTRPNQKAECKEAFGIAQGVRLSQV